MSEGGHPRRPMWALARRLFFTWQFRIPTFCQASWDTRTPHSPTPISAISAISSDRKDVVGDVQLPRKVRWRNKRGADVAAIGDSSNFVYQLQVAVL